MSFGSKSSSAWIASGAHHTSLSGDTGASEIVVLRLSGPLAGHLSSVVVPFLLPDIPVVAWWPDIAPAVPAQDPLGQLAIRRITDATNSTDPLAAIKSRLSGYTPGDTDLAWSRITYWRARIQNNVAKILQLAQRL